MQIRSLSLLEAMLAWAAYFTISTLLCARSHNEEDSYRHAVLVNNHQGIYIVVLESVALEAATLPSRMAVQRCSLELTAIDL